MNDEPWDNFLHALYAAGGAFAVLPTTLPSAGKALLIFTITWLGGMLYDKAFPSGADQQAKQEEP